MRWVEALNHAIRGLPPERIRFHLCWGSWHGPAHRHRHRRMRDIVEVMLAVKVPGLFLRRPAMFATSTNGTCGNKLVRLPDDKILLPGVVSHATNVVEHPELVAQLHRPVRRSRWRAKCVIAATDCGLGGRVHAQIAWAKLESLAQGAALASKALWR